MRTSARLNLPTRIVPKSFWMSDSSRCAKKKLPNSRAREAEVAKTYVHKVAAFRLFRPACLRKWNSRSASRACLFRGMRRRRGDGIGAWRTSGDWWLTNAWHRRNGM